MFSLHFHPAEPPVLQWSRVGFAGGADCAVHPAAPRALGAQAGNDFLCKPHMFADDNGTWGMLTRSMSPLSNIQDGASEHWTVAEYFSDDAFSESTNDDIMRYESACDVLALLFFLLKRLVFTQKISQQQLHARQQTRVPLVRRASALRRESQDPLQDVQAHARGTRISYICARDLLLTVFLNRYYCCS